MLKQSPAASVDRSKTKQLAHGESAFRAREGARNLREGVMPQQLQDGSDRLAAIDRYSNLRNWMFALVDLVEVAGQAQVAAKVEIAERTLVETAGLLRDLLEQMDSRIEVIGDLRR